ncbi:MAG: flagellar biosynthetic protein FliO [Planctomycetota bacterium]
MRRHLNLILALALVSALPAAHAQDAAPPPEAQARLAELAERYTGSDPANPTNPTKPADAARDAAATPAPAAADTPAIESTPLGQPARRLAARSSGAPGAPAGPDGQAGLDPPTGGWLLSTLAALGVVIALIFAARWVYTKLGGQVVARATPAVEVLSRTTVAPKNHVLLLRVGQRVLVVGDSSTGLRTLANLDEPEEVASILQSVTTAGDRSVSKSFNSLVARFNGEYEGKTRAQVEGGDHQEARFDQTRDSLSGLAARLRSLGGKEGA